jgi:PTS system galactitol-specific IIA component
VVIVADISFDENLVLFIDGAQTVAEVEGELSRVLHEKGCVKSSFANAICEREAEYPTALEVGVHNVAIPHCDAEHTIKGSLCIGVLRPSVTWKRMDDADESCEVELVIMLALQDSHDQLEMLQKVISLVQNQSLINQIVSTDTATQVVQLAAPHLL